MGKKINLLISNDDGIFATGLRTLANTLAQEGHDVTVVAPDRERSATGHGLTIHQPIRAQIVEDLFLPQVTAWSCSGTPADCVKLGLFGLLDTRPDFVLAGINHGPNLGTDILYSGTVSAAMEGMIEGIPSVAFSLANFTSGKFSTAAQFAQKLITKLHQQVNSEAILLNVNIPAVKPEAIAGSIITRQGLRRYVETFEQRIDPRGKSYYWLAGEAVEEVEQPEHLHLPAQFPTDVQAIKANYITITPIQHNLTDVYTFSKLNEWGWSWTTNDATEMG